MFALIAVLLSGDLDALSLQSLYINAVNDSGSALSATGFILESGSEYYLATNLHVFTGCDYYNGAPLFPDSSQPEEIHIWYHGRFPGEWVTGVESLHDPHGEPLWVTLPMERPDVALLPLTGIPDNVILHSFDLSIHGDELPVYPGMTLYIVGFPYGRSSTGKMPIWKTAHMASEYSLDVEGTRAFLIDATTREGMSGAPVFARATEEGRVLTRFLGIYSAQYLDAEIGMVWRPEILGDILNSLR